MYRKSHRYKRTIKQKNKNDYRCLVNNAKKLSIENLRQQISSYLSYEVDKVDLAQVDKKKFDFNVTFGQILNANQMRDIFELFENNMKSFYDISNSSYDPIEKRAELFHRDSRYLLVNDTTDHIVAYSHFRFDIDFKLPVIYIYEIQVTKAYQNLRLGRQIMIILEHLCQLNKMKKLILTVKKSNVHALKFYYRLDYRKDTSDPNDSDTETEYDYFILSKTI